MPEPARAGTDQDGHLIMGQTEHLVRPVIEQLRDALQLEEMVARAERPELIGAADPGAP